MSSCDDALCIKYGVTDVERQDCHINSIRIFLDCESHPLGVPVPLSAWGRIPYVWVDFMVPYIIKMTIKI